MLWSSWLHRQRNFPLPAGRAFRVLAGNLLLDLGVMGFAEAARRIEKSRVNLEGATDPGTSAKAVSRVLRALGAETGATGGTLAMTPEALGQRGHRQNTEFRAPSLSAPGSPQINAPNPMMPPALHGRAMSSS